MQRLINQKKQIIHISCDNNITEKRHITEWCDSPFQTTIEKLERKHRNADTISPMREAFIRELNEQSANQKSSDWIINNLFYEIEKDMFKPINTEFTFTKISHDLSTIFKDRNPLMKMSMDSRVESLFNLGLTRGLFLSTFPKGELLINKATMISQQKILLKNHVMARDKIESGQLPQLFNILKKDDDA